MPNPFRDFTSISLCAIERNKVPHCGLSGQKISPNVLKNFKLDNFFFPSAGEEFLEEPELKCSQVISN